MKRGAEMSSKKQRKPDKSLLSRILVLLLVAVIVLGILILPLL